MGRVEEGGSVVPVPQGRARAFHLMAKPTGAVCNLDCDYCFFLSKEQMYAGSGFRMPDDVLAAYLGGLLDAHRGADEVVVAFQGGEPTLMGLDFFARVVELERQLAAPGQRVLNTLQTNATLLDDDWGEFLAENGFLVGISIDGPAELHDAYRRDKGGKPTFDRVVRGLRAMQRHDVEWNSLTTVNAANEEHGLEVYRFLRDDLGARHLQFIPVVERATPELLPLVEDGWGGRPGRPMYRQEGHLVTQRSVSSSGHGRFLVEVFDEWLRHDVGEVFVQAFDTALAAWLGMSEVGLCVHAETCGRSLALEHNGDVYSCDHFVEPTYKVGNLADGRTLLQIVDSPEQVAFGAAKRDGLPPQCRRCEMRFACNGGCPKDRFLVTADGDPGLNYLCASYLHFFEYIDRPMRAMARVVREGGDPATVMQAYADDPTPSITTSP